MRERVKIGINNSKHGERYIAGLTSFLCSVRFEDLVLDPFGFCQSLLSFTLGALDEKIIQRNQEKVTDPSG